MKHFARIVVLLSVCALAGGARAGDRFVVVPFDALRFEGTAPQPIDQTSTPFIYSEAAHSYEPYVVLDGPGEAYLDPEQVSSWMPSSGTARRLAVRVAHEGEITGRVFAVKPDLIGFEAHKFTLAGASDDPDARANFYAVMEAHYAGLCGRNLPGAAWFRHQLHVARAGGPMSTGPGTSELFEELGVEGNQPFGRAPGVGRSFDESFELFTGERALAENLDLERGLRVAKDEEQVLDVSKIDGVSTRAIDWKALVKGLKPEIDGLAKSIPADQHGVFFPTFEGMVRVFDEIDHAGTPVLEFASARSEDQRTKERYQAQLCMPLSALARMLGPTIVAGVAITGSDPYLPSGADVAVLFECKEAAVLEKYLGLRHVEAKSAGAKAVDGTVGTTKYTGVRSDDRRICSYVARFDDTIVVTNSLAQLERIAAARGGRTPSLASADEYVWFRDRYKKAESDESALLVLSDATIRRWAGPRERIGNSRRVRAAAAMAVIQARAIDDLVRGTLVEGSSAADPALPFSSDFVWTKRGVFSPTWGSLAFMTPLAELLIERVSESEKRGYEAFRTNFQNLWSNVFDPIALRLAFVDAKLAADLTVMPLAVTTEYRELIELTRGATLAPMSGDAHADTLFHFALAFAAKSRLGEMFASRAGPFAQQLGADPLAWIGGGIAMYADRDDFWDELDRASDRSKFMEANFYRLPLVLHVEVKDALKLAGFLTSLRAMADGAAPDLTRWETKKWNEQAYVKVAVDNFTGSSQEMAVYYAAMPDAFLLTLREDLVHRAIDRRLARKAGQVDPVHNRAWLGTSLGLRIERDALDIFGGVSASTVGDRLQDAAWSALPILNEWRRRYPDQDPVLLHERLWNVRLVSPAGGTFAWNEAMQCMEASDYGSPAAPKKGPAVPQALERFTRGEFGLSFEGEGLRARAELGREPK